MDRPILTISAQTRRRFILGKQGLFPGRRWAGKDGVAQAMRAGAVVQIDPLSIIARSHDIALHSRVIDYTPELLNQVMYEERGFYDYGGTVMVYPMESLPYQRVVMARKAVQRAYLAEQNPQAVDEVLAALRERGPLANRDFAAPKGEKQYWHAAKTTAQALYWLWLKGDLMTHSRRGFERRFDLAERIVPPQHDRTASVDEADSYFALDVFHVLNLVDQRGFRNGWMGSIERPVAVDEARQRLQSLLDSGAVVPVMLDSDASNGSKDPTRYVLAEDLPLLEQVHSGRVPDEWQPLEHSSEAEAIFLAPLEIVSARGRALPLFGFEYLWEVYKPAEKRRWGYYVLPVLYGDRLVARFDPALDRKTRVMTIKGFWLEDGVALDARLESALAAGFRRFARFAGAERIEWQAEVPAVLREIG